MDIKLDIIAIGEALIELSTNKNLSNAEALHKFYGGDSLAVAISALRSGSNVGFITKVGNDAFKDFLLNSWQTEGLDVSNIKFADEPNGLYMIARASIHEKEVVYYRKKTAASKLALEDISEDYIKNSKIVYSSGITQSLSASTAEAVDSAFRFAKENGVLTAYDPNYYPLFMSEEDAKQNFESIIGNVDILFMSTKHDTLSILDLDSVENIIKSIWDRGVSTVVIKSSEKGGYYVGWSGNIVFTEFFTNKVVDTTSSGDAFNGAFLSCVARGLSPIEASKFASVAAGLQAGGIGAIKSIPYRNEILNVFKGEA